ncbi:DivIVA domain-containing protein [Zhihengliuella sp.]|uniref:DivIVA domain-containing protein n=1 Tax=Zhihengliuella sp. TaxID=1954483 RepID=UPI0028121EBD|nr:DivIVA domain-containing protein [Zhihengliuella sp.]
MSQSETRQPGLPFSTVAPTEYGYSIEQVDEFLARARATFNGTGSDDEVVTSHLVRRVSFDPEKGGYEARPVDAALDRLEDVFAKREREALVEAEGEEAWLQQVGRLSTILRGRLHREPGERFRRPSRRNAPSYNIQDVDALCDKLLEYFEKDVPMSVDTIRRATFRQARGQEGYEESQVDAFLDRVVELMASID